MEQILKQLENKPSWKEAMRKTCRQNKLNVDLVAYYTPLRFKSAHNNFLFTHERKNRGASQRWLENQLKAFYWICVALSCIRDKKISAFKEQDWDILHQVFPFKKLITLEYEALRMTVEAGRQVEWTSEEDAQLSHILSQEEEGSNKWNQFARLLYEKSQRKFLRSGKQCRQRWLNHLDPSKKRGNWQPDEDRRLVQLLLKMGKRWSKVAKNLGSQRTEHMVKNRYKTIIGRQKRRHPTVHNEQSLFKLFLQGEPLCKEDISLVESKPREETKELNQKPHVQEEKYKRGITEEVAKEEFQCMAMDDQEVADSQQVMATPRLLDLPQVYSPWFVGVPITPTISPSVSFFINVPNFSSYDHNFANSFYNPAKAEGEE